MTMRKIHVLWLVLAAVFALGSLVAGSAFAAQMVWLHDGARIVSPVRPISSVAALLLQDTGIEVSLLFKGLFAGMVGPGPDGEITKVTVEKEAWEINGPCFEEPKPVAEIINLPWLTKLILEGREYRAKIASDSKGRPAYLIECETLIGRIADICFTDGVRMLMRNTSSQTVAAVFDVNESGEEECTGTPFSGKGFITAEGEPLLISGEGDSRLSIGEE